MQSKRAHFILIIFLLSVGFSSAQQASQTISTGFVTDTLCGAKGANEFHTDCAKRSVASGKAKYALYDDRARRFYIIDGSASLTTRPQGTIEQYLGQRVRITGTLSASPLRNADEMLAPDSTAGLKDTSGNAPRSSDPARVQRHARAKDSTPIGGVLTVSSIELAPLPNP